MKTSPPLQFKPINDGLGFHNTIQQHSVSTTHHALSPAPAAKPPVFSTESIEKKVLPQAETPSLWLPLLRAWAYLIDSLFNFSLCCLTFWVLLVSLEIPLDSLFDQYFALILLFFLMVFNWATIAAQEVLFGSTLGKRLFLIRVEGTATNIFWRSLLFHCNFFLLGIPLLFVFGHSNLEAWHDRLTHVQLRRTAFL